MATDGAVNVSGVCELVLEQSDLVAAEDFYSGVLGFPVVERWTAEGAAAFTSTTRWGYRLTLTMRSSSGFESAVIRCWTTITSDMATVAGAPPTSLIRAAMWSNSGPGTWQVICESWLTASRPAHTDSTAKRRRRPGRPLRACSPRSANVIPEPATRSRTVAETSTSPGAAVAATRAAV